MIVSHAGDDRKSETRSGQGTGRIEHYQTNFINPDGSFYGLAQDQLTWTPFASAKAKSPADVGDVQMKLLNVATAPASRTGEVILAHNFLGSRAADAWIDRKSVV